MADEEGSENASPPESPKSPPLSKLQQTIGGHSKYIADHFDRLYEEVDQLKKDMAATENRLRMEMDSKLKALQDLLTLRIVTLDTKTDVHSIQIADIQSLQKQQGNQLDDLQNQVGVLFYRFH